MQIDQIYWMSIILKLLFIPSHCLFFQDKEKIQLQEWKCNIFIMVKYFIFV